MNINEERKENIRIVNLLMDPNNDLVEMNKEVFTQYLKRDTVFDDIAN